MVLGVEIQRQLFFLHRRFHPAAEGKTQRMHPPFARCTPPTKGCRHEMSHSHLVGPVAPDRSERIQATMEPVLYAEPVHRFRPLDEAGHRAAAATRGTVPLVHGVAIATLIYLSCPKAQQTAPASSARQSALLPGPIPFVRLLPGTAPFWGASGICSPSGARQPLGPPAGHSSPQVITECRGR